MVFSPSLRPSPVTFSSSVTVTATSGSPAGASSTLVRFNSFLSSVPVPNVFLKKNPRATLDFGTFGGIV